MDCPYCQSKSNVTNSRKRAGGTQVWRRRTCKKCGLIWTTSEQIDMSTTHRVISSQNVLQPFQRDLLFESIKESLRHRKTAIEDASALTDTVLAKVLLEKSPTLTTARIRAITHDIVRRYDATAGAVYLALHP